MCCFPSFVHRISYGLENQRPKEANSHKVVIQCLNYVNSVPGHRISRFTWLSSDVQAGDGFLSVWSFLGCVERQRYDGPADQSDWPKSSPSAKEIESPCIGVHGPGICVRRTLMVCVDEQPCMYSCMWPWYVPDHLTLENTTRLKNRGLSGWICFVVPHVDSHKNNLWQPLTVQVWSCILRPTEMCNVTFCHLCGKLVFNVWQMENMCCRWKWSL